MTEPDLFTSESITMGHPDKVADQVSDGPDLVRERGVGRGRHAFCQVREATAVDDGTLETAEIGKIGHTLKHH